jgi:PAS domain S-box-containing protein
VNDVTEARRTESALQRHVQIVDQIHDGVIATDLGARVTYWSKGAERLFGYPADEAIGRHVSFLYLPEDLELLDREVIGPLLAKGEHAVEKRVVRKSGDVIFVHLALSLLRDAFGRPTGIVGYSMDVTARRRAEESLRAGEERLRLALATGRMCAWDWNVVTDRVLWSDPSAGVAGGGPGTAEAYLRAVHPDDRERLRSAVRRATGAGLAFQEQYRVVSADGAERWMAAAGRALPDGSGKPLRLVGVAQDVSEQKRAEAEREELLAAAQQARAGAEAASHGKDEFLAMLGHELRNPLGAVRNAVMAARFSAGERDAALDIARRQVDQLTRLVDDLLDVERVTRGRIQLRTEWLDLASVVRSAVQTARPLLDDRGHVLVVEHVAEDLEVEADRARLEQILVNLLSNAAKYTPPGGRIEVTTAPDGVGAVIRVCDNGVGIETPMLARVFDLFSQSPQTLDRAQGGLGIGLTIVRRLVELHRGLVEARSDGPGRGAEFVVRLPGARRCETTATREPPRPRARGGMRILVVEDNIEAAQALCMMLVSVGHAVEIAYHGVAALESLERSTPTVVLLDIGLPGIDGYEVARRMRQRPGMAGAVIVAVTGYGRRDDRARAIAAGFDYHLVKPVDPEELVDLLDAIAGQRLEPVARASEL